MSVSSDPERFDGMLTAMAQQCEGGVQEKENDTEDNDEKDETEHASDEKMSPTQVEKIETELIQWLRETNKYDQFVSKFNSCLTNIERVACLYSLPVTTKLFQVQENFGPKDKDEADWLREEGNRLFRNKKYLAAMNVYSQSILKAPNDSEILPLVYNNRSTTNFYMKKYSLCLLDIELAFMHNYPPSSCHKLFIRKGKCMYYLNHKEEAIRVFRQCIIVVERSEMFEEVKKKTISEIQTFLDLCAGITSPPSSLSTNCFNCCHQGIPQMTSPASKEVPCMSKDIEIKLDSYGGRGLFAKEDIEIGSVLFVESPFSSCLLNEFNATHCQYCCNRVYLAVPCRQCSAVVFCSLECRDDAWEKFHWAECCVLENIQNSQESLSSLATRMVLTAGIDDLLKFDEKLAEVKNYQYAGFDEDSVDLLKNYGAVFSLVNHADKRGFKDLLNCTISAVFILKNLELVGYFSKVTKQIQYKHLAQSLDQDLDLNLKHIVGGHILRNLMMLRCNAHVVSEFSLNTKDLSVIGGAAYPVLSLMNHSCDHSVVRHSYGNICVVRSIRGIRRGEELKDNYGDLYYTLDKTARVEKLRKQYFFDCKCEACVYNWPQYFDIPYERPIFRCHFCDGQVPINTCTTCNHLQTLVILVLKCKMKDYGDATDAFVKGNSDHENVRILLNYLSFIDKHVHRPFKEICTCQELFKEILNINANCYKCTDM